MKMPLKGVEGYAINKFSAEKPAFVRPVIRTPETPEYYIYLKNFLD